MSFHLFNDDIDEEDVNGDHLHDNQSSDTENHEGEHPPKTEHEKQYRPYDRYNYERVHGKRYYDDQGHQVPPPRREPNNLAKLALAMAFFTVALGCCSPYAGIAGAVMSITVGICSRFYNNPERRFHGQAIAAIIVGTIMLILLLGSFLITYALVPYLMDKYPEFRETYNQVYRMFQNRLEDTASSGAEESLSPSVSAPTTVPSPTLPTEAPIYNDI